MLANVLPFYLVFSFVVCISTKSISNTWINLKTNDISSLSPSSFDVNDPSRRGNNRTVTFVPLISVIAHYLPTFLKRLRTQEIISARSLNWLLTDEEICTPHHLGRFPNPDNRCQFFECAMNFKNFVNCSQHQSTIENSINYNPGKHISDVIELKSKTESNNNGDGTSIAVVYKVNECVSLILHQCSADHTYSNRLQRCIFHGNVQCPD